MAYIMYMGINFDLPHYLQQPKTQDKRRREFSPPLMIYSVYHHFICQDALSDER